MGHQHHHHQASTSDAVGNRRRLAMALVLTAAYMVAEIVGGLAANSLALLADAGHMFSDAAALGLSLVAVILAQRRRRRNGPTDSTVRKSWRHFSTVPHCSPSPS